MFIKTQALPIILFILIFVNCAEEKKSSKYNTNSKDSVVKEKTSWKFVAFGDSRGHSSKDPVNTEILKTLVHEIIAEKVDFVLFTGDICYGHANRKILGDNAALEDLKTQMLSFRNTIDPLYKNGIKVYIVRGNHETTQRFPDKPGTAEHRPIWPETKKIWDEVFSGEYGMPKNGPSGEENVTFFASHKNALIIGFDLYSPRGTTTNIDGSIPKPLTKRVHQSWLDSVLATNKKKHIFTFSHEPAFKVDHRDCMHGDDSYQLDYSSYRDRFWKSLTEAGSKVYFCGHDHGFAAASIIDTLSNNRDTLYQIVVGTAGAGKSIKPVYDGYNSHYKVSPIQDSKSFGFVIGELNNNEATFSYRFLNQKKEFENLEIVRLSP